MIDPLASYFPLKYRFIIGFMIFAGLFGVLGYFDVRGIGSDLKGSVENPTAFMTVWGIHWGTYTGGFLGLLFAIYKIRRERKRCSRRMAFSSFQR